MEMSYRVGEMAELFGLTTEGIRYLEKRGFIDSHRESNGYRLYPDTEKPKLKHIRSLCAMGFSLEEVERMMGHLSRDAVTAAMDAKREELAHRAEELARMRRLLAEYSELLERALQCREHFDLIKSPDMLFLPSSGRDADAHHDRAEKAWIAAMPPVVMGVLYEEGKAHRGLLVGAAEAEALGLPAPDGLIRIGSQTCVHGALETPLREHRDFRLLIQWAQAHGWRHAGSMYCMMRMIFMGPDAREWALDEAFLPVEET